MQKNTGIAGFFAFLVPKSFQVDLIYNQKKKMIQIKG